MTKPEFQKELKEKVKEGVKPSQLKKSRSTENISLTPPEVPLERSKSAEPLAFNDPKYPYTTLVTQGEEIEQLKKESKAKSETIKLLRKKIEQMEKTTPLVDLSSELKRSKEKNQLLLNQFQTKQKSLESLRKKLEETNSELNSLKKEKSNLLDTNLELKHQSLKD